jgi:hypothetical protein
MQLEAIDAARGNRDNRKRRGSSRKDRSSSSSSKERSKSRERKVKKRAIKVDRKSDVGVGFNKEQRPQRVEREMPVTRRKEKDARSP